MDLKPAILERYEKLPKSNKIVADYFMTNWESVAFSTLEEMSKRIGVSTTTIIRFARALGYSGFSAIQQEVQNDLKNKATLPKRLEISMEHTQRNQLLADSFKNDIINLNKTLENISSEEINRAVDFIIKAANVYILGIRATYSVAHYMAVRLGQVKENVRLIHGVGGIYPEETVSIKPGDVCLAYMSQRYSRVSMNMLIWMKKAGATIIAITGPSHAALDNYADVLLPCWTHSMTVKSSLVAPMCLSQYLVAEVAIADYPNSKQVLEKIENALQQGDYFVL